MKVMVVAPRFPPEVGGLEQYAAWTARTLKQAGHEVTIVTTSPSRDRSQSHFEGMPVHRLGTWATVSNTPVNPAWWRQVRTLMRTENPDVINVHAPVPGLADIAVLRATAPVVFTYHAGSMVKGGHVVDGLLRAYERRVLPRLFSRARSLVAVSPVSLAHATGRAVLVPPGVDPDHFRPAEPPNRLPRVLYVGRIERTSRWKGLSVLLEALPRLIELVPEARLELVGDGDDVPTLQAQAQQLGVDGAIDWLGRVEHDQLPGRYQRAGVTVLPSLTEAESFGMTLVEAMACGSPVVGSAVGGIPHVIRDDVEGLLVPPGDAQSLAAALASILTSPECSARYAAAGRAAACQRWAWSLQEQRLLEVIQGAAQSHPGRVSA